MEFEEALKLLKKGEKVYNSNWNGLKDNKIMYIFIQKPDENSYITNPYLVMNIGIFNDGWQFKRCPWIPSQTDIMSNTWELREKIEVSTEK